MFSPHTLSFVFCTVIKVSCLLSFVIPKEKEKDIENIKK